MGFLELAKQMQQEQMQTGEKSAKSAKTFQPPASAILKTSDEVATGGGELPYALIDELAVDMPPIVTCFRVGPLVPRKCRSVPCAIRRLGCLVDAARQ